MSVPCPISDRAIRMTTVSSGFTTTQALTSGSVSAAAAASLKGIWNPTGQAADGGGRPDQEGTAIEFRLVIHVASLPQALAVMEWIAARTC